MVVPEPDWVTAPVPEIRLPTVSSLERLKATVPELAIPPEPGDPVVPPFPRVKEVPADTVVAPV